MKEYLVDKKEDIKGLEVVERKIEITPNKNFAIAIIGPRRAGKSFTCYYLIKKWKIEDEDYLFINFEDDEIKRKNREEIVKCIQTHVEIYGTEPNYLFFDEIQNLQDWQSFIYSIVEKKRYFTFVTGSSSKLLSKEIATQLRGRSLNCIVFPFSFEEFLISKKFPLKKIYSSIEISKIKNYLLEYLMKGGFPDVVLEKIKEKVFAREYINVILYRDLIERFKIKNIDAMRFLLYSMVESFSKEFSINKVFNQMKEKGMQVSKNVLYEYFSYIQEVFFSFLLKKFYYSYRKSELSIPKIYMNDVGIANNLSKYQFSENIGKLMENLVFLELKKQELNNIIEIFYWKDYQQNEVDFVIKEGLNIKQLIQVTYASGKDEIEKREIQALLKASQLLKCKNLLCITWDYEDELKIKNKKIKFLPLWKWLFFNLSSLSFFKR
jgi:predicted AAA+ superfamily ATPase